MWAVVASILARILVSFFRAWAYGVGESGRDGCARGWWWRRFFIALNGFTGKRHECDFWLPAIIGFCEAAAYPILMRSGELAVIGAWLALKTAPQWRVWAKSSSAFSRFLFGNLVILALSYFWLQRYVILTP